MDESLVQTWHSPVCDQILEFNELLIESNDKKRESYLFAGFAYGEIVLTFEIFNTPNIVTGQLLKNQPKFNHIN